MQCHASHYRQQGNVSNKSLQSFQRNLYNLGKINEDIPIMVCNIELCIKNDLILTGKVRQSNLNTIHDETNYPQSAPPLFTVVWKPH